MSLEALIFDVDGTLAETEDAHRLAFNAAFDRFALDWHWSADLYRDLLQVAGGRERMRHYAERYRPQDLARFDAVIDELHLFKAELHAQMIREGQVAARPGVRRLIHEAHAAGLHLGVATTTTRQSLAALLSALIDPQAPDWFAVRVTGDMVKAKKPDPAAYLVALERLGLGPDRCLAFEDSRVGLAASRAAGLPTIVTPSRQLAGDDTTGALAVLSDLGEPDRPYDHIAGQGAADAWVSVAVLRRWHTEAGVDRETTELL